MSRGGKEGNNAFTKDQNVPLFDEQIHIDRLMKGNSSIKFINNLIQKKKIQKKDVIDHCIINAVR